MTRRKIELLRILYHVEINMNLRTIELTKLLENMQETLKKDNEN